MLQNEHLVFSKFRFGTAENELSEVDICENSGGFYQLLVNKAIANIGKFANSQGSPSGADIGKALVRARLAALDDNQPGANVLTPRFEMQAHASAVHQKPSQFPSIFFWLLVRLGQ